jgi:hypothetical protein
VTGAFACHDATRATIAVRAFLGEPIVVDPRTGIERRLDQTIARWQTWAARCEYSLDTSPGRPAQELDADGYRGTRPVRAGNDASSQLHVGTYGDLFTRLGSGCGTDTTSTSSPLDGSRSSPTS